MFLFDNVNRRYGCFCDGIFSAEKLYDLPENLFKNQWHSDAHWYWNIGTSSSEEMRRGWVSVSIFVSLSSMCICLFMHMSSMIRLVYSNFICAHSFFLSSSDNIHSPLCVCVYILVCLISIFSTSEGANKANMLIKTETRFQEFSSFDIKVNRRENLWTIRAQRWRIWFLVSTVSWIFMKRYKDMNCRARFWQTDFAAHISNIFTEILCLTMIRENFWHLKTK